MSHKKHQLYYKVEDTSDLCYRDIISALERRQWLPFSPSSAHRPHKKKSKFEKRLAIFRNVSTGSFCPDFLWTISEKAIDFERLHPSQLVNHFQGMSAALTTKNGLCDTLRELVWLGEDLREVSPRCFNLGDPTQRAEFTDDFQLCAAINIIKFVACPPFPPDLYMPEETIEDSLRAVTRHLYHHGSGDCFNQHSRRVNSDNGKREGNATNKRVTFMTLKNRPSARDRSYGKEEVMTDEHMMRGLDDAAWDTILAASYRLAMSMPSTSCGNHHSRPGGGGNRSCVYTAVLRAPSSSPRQVRAALLLLALRSMDPQFDINGGRNIWVVKAPEACRGTNIRLMNRLADILALEKGMGGRTVQKYIETPLLTNHCHDSRPLSHKSPLPQLQRYRSLSYKFDLRVWVVVTSCSPLRAQIFSTVYGRKCGRAYNYAASSIADTYTHLTNYSIQSKGGLLAPVVKSTAADVDINGIGVDEEDEAGLEESQLDRSVQSDSQKDKHIIKQKDERGAGVASRLRSAIRSQRGNSQGACRGHTDMKEQTSASSELLITHAQLINELSFLHPQQDGSSFWGSVIWPAVKRKIYILLSAAAQKVTPRDNSFEFLGVDVLLDEGGEPWVLEVNMSPAMAHRNKKQSALIRNMTEQMVALLLGEKNEIRVGDEEGCAGKWEQLVEGTRTETLHHSPHRSHSQARASKSQAHPNCAENYRNSFGYVEPATDDTCDDTDNDRHKDKDFTPSLDMSFTLRGFAITPSVILDHDNCNIAYAAVLLLQRWSRRYLSRTRIFHHRQYLACHKVQQCYRMFSARGQLLFLRQHHASVTVQSAWRRKMARIRCVLLRLSAAAGVIQQLLRKWLDGKRKRRKMLKAFASKLGVWYCCWRNKRKTKRARCIQRNWRIRHKRHQSAARVIGRAAVVWVRLRFAAAYVISRVWHRKFVRDKWHVIWRHRVASRLGSAAAEVGRLWEARRLQQRQEKIEWERAEAEAREKREEIDKAWRHQQQLEQTGRRAWLEQAHLVEEREQSSQRGCGDCVESGRRRSAALHIMTACEDYSLDAFLRKYTGDRETEASRSPGTHQCRDFSHDGDTNSSEEAYKYDISGNDNDCDRTDTDSCTEADQLLYVESTFRGNNPNITFLGADCYERENDGFCRRAKNAPPPRRALNDVERLSREGRETRRQTKRIEERLKKQVIGQDDGDDRDDSLDGGDYLSDIRVVEKCMSKGQSNNMFAERERDTSNGRWMDRDKHAKEDRNYRERKLQQRQEELMDQVGVATTSTRNARKSQTRREKKSKEQGRNKRTPKGKKSSLAKGREKLRMQWAESEGRDKNSPWSREDMHQYIAERQAYLSAAMSSSQPHDSHFRTTTTDCADSCDSHTKDACANHSQANPHPSAPYDLNAFRASSAAPPGTDPDVAYDQQLEAFMRKVELRKMPKQHKTHHKEVLGEELYGSDRNSGGRHHPRSQQPSECDSRARQDGRRQEGGDFFDPDDIFVPYLSHHNVQTQRQTALQKQKQYQQREHQDNEWNRTSAIPRRATDIPTRRSNTRSDDNEYSSWEAAWHGEDNEW